MSVLPVLVAAAIAATPVAEPAVKAPVDPGSAGRSALEAPGGAGPGQPPAPGDLQAELGAADALWPVRDLPGKEAELERALELAAARAPGAAEVLWRQARLLVWQSEDPGRAREQRSVLGKRAWELAERAIAAAPRRVEGYFYSAAGMGTYSLGIGVFQALLQGIEGKFRERLAQAEAIEPGFLRGAIPTAWGRLWYELPWPKHDARRSEEALRRAVAEAPENVRALVYLGDVEADEGRRDAAREAYGRALAVAPEATDPPEARRWQATARERLARMGAR